MGVEDEILGDMERRIADKTDYGYFRFGLTREVATARGIRPLEYVKIELPEFAEEAARIPPDLSAKIKSLDLVWTLSIEGTYEQRRRWDEIMAFREFLQNSLDGTHAKYGYDGAYADIHTDGLGTWVCDSGGGITYRAFPLGGVEKACEMRGAYGEGLKIGLLWFSKRGYPVYIFTREKAVYKCYYSEIADSLVIVMGESVEDTDGTHVLIDGYKTPGDWVKWIYYKTAELTPIATYYSPGDCGVSMPNMVLTGNNALYVRDIYVNKMSTITGVSSVFSYNLWWVKLEPNRVGVASRWDLDTEISRVLMNTDRILTLIDRMCVKSEYGGIKYNTILPEKYETKISYRDVSQGTEERVRELMDTRHISAYSDINDLDGLAAVAHEGGRCILVPEGMKNLFAGLPKASKMVIDSIRELSAEPGVIDVKTLTGGERACIQKWVILADKISPETTLVITSKDRSYYNRENDTIFTSKKKLCEDGVYIHELAHAIGFRYYGSAPDVSENFERSLEYIGAAIVVHMRDEKVIAAISRAMGSLCVNATAKSMREFFETLLPYIDGAIATDMFNYPSRLVLIIRDTPGESVPLSVVRGGSIFAYDPPCEEIYDKVIKSDIDLLRSVRIKLKTGEADVNEAYAELCTGTMLWEKITLTGSEVTIYAYSLRNDYYEKLAVIE